MVLSVKVTQFSKQNGRMSLSLNSCNAERDNSLISSKGVAEFLNKRRKRALATDFISQGDTVFKSRTDEPR